MRFTPFILNRNLISGCFFDRLWFLKKEVAVGKEERLKFYTLCFKLFHEFLSRKKEIDLDVQKIKRTLFLRNVKRNPSPTLTTNSFFTSECRKKSHSYQ